MESKFQQKKNSGFTLIETLVALGLGVLVATILGTTMVLGINSIKGIQQKERLHSDALVFTETLQYWIKRSSELTVVSPTELQVLLPNAYTKIIEKNGDDIFVNGALLTTDGIKVSNLKFVKISNSIRVAFTFTSEESDDFFSATTTITQRNIP